MNAPLVVSYLNHLEPPKSGLPVPAKWPCGSMGFDGGAMKVLLDRVWRFYTCSGEAEFGDPLDVFLHSQTQQYDNMEVSQVMGVPPNHPFIDGFSIIKHPCWGTPIYGKSHGMSMLGQYPLDPWFLSEPTMMVPDGCPIFGIIESTNQLISLRKCQCWAIPIGYMIIFQVAVN